MITYTDMPQQLYPIVPHLRGAECFQEYLERYVSETIEFDGYGYHDSHLGRVGPLNITGGLMPLDLAVKVTLIAASDIPETFVGEGPHELPFVGRLKHLSSGVALYQVREL